MHKGSGNQNTSSKMLGTKKERRRNAKAGELGDEDGKCATSRGYEQDEEQTTDMKPEVVVGLSRTRLAGTSAAEAVNGRIACGWSAHVIPETKTGFACCRKLR
jgi:hypothetical protein